MVPPPPLVPELDVESIEASLDFYCRVCDFAVKFERTDEGFAYLERAGAEIMLQSAYGEGRRFRTAPLERPFGRGVNFQIEVRAVEQLYQRVVAEACEIVLPLEKRWYETEAAVVCNHQFVVADPDGYLLRFYQDLGNHRE